MTAHEFNELNQVGCPVILTDDFGKTHQTFTTSMAWNLCGTDVVNTKLYRAYDLNRIKAAETESKIK